MAAVNSRKEEERKKMAEVIHFKTKWNWKLFAYLSLLKQLRFVLLFIPNATRECRIRSKHFLKCRTSENNERVESGRETEGGEREKNLEGGNEKLQKQTRGLG